MIRALKPGGIWYMSFKERLGEAYRNGRFYNDYEGEQLRSAIQEQPELQLIQLWTTGRPTGTRAGALGERVSEEA